MIKIAHECPNIIFDSVQENTDYDYALVHLLEQDPEYKNKFFKARYDEDREIILDNSIFELGEAFNHEKYADWVDELNPKHYIIPDVLADSQATIDTCRKWLNKYSHLESKPIGVAHGKTYNEFIECYDFLSVRVDKIAIPFISPMYDEWYPNEPTKYHTMMKGRIELIGRMAENCDIFEGIDHHLLGCGLPQEFLAYRTCDFIDSVDTSNPVLHGMIGKRYGALGLDDKDPTKMHTLINDDISDKMDDIMYNIKKFREFCNGVK